VSRTTLRDRLLACAHRTVARFASELREDGSFGARHQDLASYYKSAALLLAAGRWDLADGVLGFIAQRFMQEDGDFATPDAGTSADPGLAAHPARAGAWIAVAAQRLGRFEISEPAWSRLKRFLHPDLGGACLEGPYEAEAARHVEMSTTALLGLCALYFGDGEIVHRAAETLVRFLDQQPDPARRMLLRMDGRGQLVDDSAAGHEIVADATEQSWDALGIPIAFLGLLHRVTTSGEALRAARGYLDFALACPTLAGELHAHQVAWGAAILGEIARAPRYLDASVAIARNLIATQSAAGLWREAEAPPHTCFDDSAESALCLLEIARVGAIATRPERSRAEVTATAWRRGVGAWSLRHGRSGPEGDPSP
jgi:hypothetical protein